MEKYEFDENSWHWKLYMLGIAMWAAFLDNGLWEYERPNFCSYVRTLGIYLPIMLMLNMAIFTSPIWVMSYIYFKFDGNILFETLMWLRWILYVIIAIFIAAVILWAIKNIIHRFTQKENVENEAEEDEATENASTSGTTSFTHVILQFLSDRHNMICRPITVKNYTGAKEDSNGIS